MLRLDSHQQEQQMSRLVLMTLGLFLRDLDYFSNMTKLSVAVHFTIPRPQSRWFHAIVSLKDARTDTIFFGLADEDLRNGIPAAPSVWP